ncbi:MAG: hypothetical protein LBH59_04945 [Planctomycetaceae bacterium]|jgi:hypothetical protein|nr:hypothetical protein [Planctomycetaceae bacterium]
MADDIKTVVVTDAMVKEWLLEIEKVNKNLKEKNFFPTVPPYPSTRDERDKIETDFEASTRVNIQIKHLLWGSSYVGKNNIKYRFNRNDRVELYLALIHNCRKAIDKNFKPVPLQKNVWPEPDESDYTGQLLIGGMRPDDIKHPKTRENYIKARWENSKNIYESSLHRHLTEMVTDTERYFTSFALSAYSESPRADQELIDLLEQYKYPKEKMLKLLCDLEVPYQGFRNWESTDGLFKTTAKFISLEKDEVTIEKGNGKRTSIELKYLRQIDKDFVNKQSSQKIEPPNTQ